jgi:hypothetical protein
LGGEHSTTKNIEIHALNFAIDFSTTMASDLGKRMVMSKKEYVLVYRGSFIAVSVDAGEFRVQHNPRKKRENKIRCSVNADAARDPKTVSLLA